MPWQQKWNEFKNGGKDIFQDVLDWIETNPEAFKSAFKEEESTDAYPRDCVTSLTGEFVANGHKVYIRAEHVMDRDGGNEDVDVPEFVIDDHNCTYCMDPDCLKIEDAVIDLMGM